MGPETKNIGAAMIGNLSDFVMALGNVLLIWSPPFIPLLLLSQKLCQPKKDFLRNVENRLNKREM